MPAKFFKTRVVTGTFAGKGVRTSQNLNKSQLRKHVATEIPGTLDELRRTRVVIDNPGGGGWLSDNHDQDDGYEDIQDDNEEIIIPDSLFTTFKNLQGNPKKRRNLANRQRLQANWAKTLPMLEQLACTGQLVACDCVDRGEKRITLVRLTGNFPISGRCGITD